MSIDECVEKATGYIGDQGTCLLLFDVKGSGTFKDPRGLINRLKEMMGDLNSRFSEYLPENDLATYVRKEKGFEILLGDASWAAINSADAIREIVAYQQQHYPSIPLYWGVAKDGFDKEGTKIAK